MRASEPPGNLGAAPPWRLPLPSPPLSNRRDAAAGRKRQPMAGASNYYKSRQASRPLPLATSRQPAPTTDPDGLRAVRHAVSFSQSASGRSLGRRETQRQSKMAAAASQGGRAGGGGGSSGAGGGSGCGTGGSRLSGLLDKVRSRSLGTVEAWGAPGRQRVLLPSLAPFLLRLLRGSSRWPTVGTLTCACSQLPTYHLKPGALSS